MSLFIEYYEVATINGYEYYYMPYDSDAKNKENMDSQSHRIWRFNTRTNRFTEILNRRKDKPQADRAELLKIQLMANPVPYSEYFCHMEEIKRIREERERHQASESSSVD